MSRATTFLFQEIFPDYDTWELWADEMGIINMGEELDKQFNEFCYTQISRHYYNQNIRYNESDAFLNELAIVYADHFAQYRQQKIIIDAIQNTTLEEIQLLSQTISKMVSNQEQEDDSTADHTNLVNEANNPNTQPEDATKPLNYISRQNYNIFNNKGASKSKGKADASNDISIRGGRLGSYVVALQQMPSAQIREFLDRYRYLFMQMLPNNVYLYYEVED